MVSRFTIFLQKETTLTVEENPCFPFSTERVRSEERRSSDFHVNLGPQANLKGDPWAIYTPKSRNPLFLVSHPYFSE